MTVPQGESIQTNPPAIATDINRMQTGDWLHGLLLMPK